MLKNKIKPCPFCGRDPVLVDKTFRAFGQWNVVLSCPDCMLTMASATIHYDGDINDPYTTPAGTKNRLERAKEDLINRWNRRQNNDKV